MVEPVVALALHQLDKASTPDVRRCQGCGHALFEVQGRLLADVHDALGEGAGFDELLAVRARGGLVSSCTAHIRGHVRGHVSDQEVRTAVVDLLAVMGPLPDVSTCLEARDQLEADGWVGTGEELLKAASELGA